MSPDLYAEFLMVMNNCCLQLFPPQFSSPNFRKVEQPSLLRSHKTIISHPILSASCGVIGHRGAGIRINGPVKRRSCPNESRKAYPQPHPFRAFHNLVGSLGSCILLKSSTSVLDVQSPTRKQVQWELWIEWKGRDSNRLSTKGNFSPEFLICVNVGSVGDVRMDLFLSLLMSQYSFT